MKSKIVSYLAVILSLLIAVNLFSAQKTAVSSASKNKPECLSSFQANNNSEYINWLLKQSMLYQSTEKLSKDVSGKGIQWRHSYFLPQPKEVVKRASAWLDIYPISMIGRKGQNTLQFLAEDELWSALHNIGIKAIHTNPMQTAGGIVKKQYTPSVDGGYDPIMYKIAAHFGTEAEYKEMVKTAKKFGGIIVGSIIPGHTGLGADFRLAELNYGDYPGIYSMVEIKKEDWNLLPDVPNQWDSVYVGREAVEKLHKKGYLPGRLQNVRFKPPGLEDKVTGWDATAPIRGVDGKIRRWVYLHYYRPGQATMNWLDPSFAAQRIIAGAIINNFNVLGNRLVRLDANAYLGIEPKNNSEVTWSDATPLTIEASNYIAMFARKMGGWTFQEVGQPLPIMKESMRLGPDITIDFITRTGLIHAVFSGDARLLNLELRQMLEAGISPGSLMHCLQSHDNFGYGMPNLQSDADKKFKYGTEILSGDKIRNQVLEDLKHTKPYIRCGSSNICTTYCGLLASRFGIDDLKKISKADKEKIKNGLVLATMYCAMQPGIIMISGWDIVGALPLSLNDKSIEKYLKQGDYRWLNRGSYDLAGFDPNIDKSAEGITKAVPLFGPITEQLKNPKSYASILKHILDMREKYQIPLSEMLGVADTKNPAVMAFVNKLPETKGYEITALNFGDHTEKIAIDLNKIKGIDISQLNDTAVIDILNNDQIDSKISSNGILDITLSPITGKALLIK
jgi:trehalose synthase